MTWVVDIHSLELVLTLEAEEAVPLPPVKGQGKRQLISPNRYLEQRDIERVKGLLGLLKQAFPNLRRLTLMLTVQESRDDDIVMCRRSGLRRRPSLSGQICCLLQDEHSNFCETLMNGIAPAMEAMALNYAAFKWRVSCGDKECTTLFRKHLWDGARCMRLIAGTEHITAVLKDRRMPSWA